MFRKIVSNLPFSPALVGQLGFYSKKLRKETITRQLGLAFVILFIIIQSLAILQPPDSANTSNLTTATNTNTPSNNSNLVKSITSTSTSQGFVDATTVTAYTGDQISYTATIQNNGNSKLNAKFEVPLTDILEYSILIDKGAGVIDNNGILSWPEVTIEQDTKQTRTFVVRILDSIPATSRGLANTQSYDCKMTNIFGNTIDINVDCPTIKTVENIITSLPKTGITENIIFTTSVFFVVLYLYARSRLLNKEVKIIRKDISSGTI